LWYSLYVYMYFVPPSLDTVESEATDEALFKNVLKEMPQISLEELAQHLVYNGSTGRWNVSNSNICVYDLATHLYTYLSV
jgi:hypothetical protein